MNPRPPRGQATSCRDTPSGSHRHRPAPSHAEARVTHYVVVHPEGPIAEYVLSDADGSAGYRPVATRTGSARLACGPEISVPSTGRTECRFVIDAASDDSGFEAARDETSPGSTGCCGWRWGRARCAGRRGRLLAVAAWEKVGRLEQANRLAEAAAMEGLVYPAWGPQPAEVGANLDEHTVQVLVVLLDAWGEGADVEIDGLVSSLLHGRVDPDSWRFDHDAGDGRARRRGQAADRGAARPGVGARRGCSPRSGSSTTRRSPAGRRS